MHRIIPLISVVLIAFSCSQPVTEEKQTSQAEGDLGELRQDSTFNFEKKLEEINNEIKEDENNPNLWHQRAYVYFHQGMIEEAVSDVKKAIKLSPDAGEFYFSKGLFFHADLQLEKARTAFEQALERSPDLKDANLYLAKIQLALRNYEEAYKHVNDALKTDPFYSQAYFIKGMIHEDRGDSTRAANTYKTALEQDPDYYDAFIRLALLHSGWGDSVAVDYFNSALELRPESPEALYGLGMYYQNQGRFDEAEATYNRILELDSAFTLAYYNIGYLYLEYSDDMDKAIRYFVEAVKKNPGAYLKFAYFNLGLAHERKGDKEKAEEFYDMALQVDPQYTEAAQGKGRVTR